MQPSAYDLKNFYTDRMGRVIRRTLQKKIRDIWPDLKDMRILGCGYALPYLKPFDKESERVVALLPKTGGVHNWPPDKNALNRTGLIEQSALPLETNSIDRALIIHDLEFCDDLGGALSEIWRVLKPTGRILVIVPNRTGLWAQADWSPFGQGRPYSATQLCRLLDDNMFTYEMKCEALFMPPLRMNIMMKSAAFFEKTGEWIPFPGGVHVIEASKQIYAKIDKGHKARVKKPSGIFVPKPAMPYSNRSRFKT